MPKPKQPKRVTISLRLPQDVVRKIDRVRSGVLSREAWIRQAIAVRLTGCGE